MTRPDATPAAAPAVFVPHGPSVEAAKDDGPARGLRLLAESHPLPRAILVVSAHWEEARPLRITGAGADDLAREAAERLTTSGRPARVDPDRGLDHGAEVMRTAYPGVPLLQLSLPAPRSAAEVLEMGRLLAPLRRQGVLLAGSGGIVHNLRRLDRHDPGAPVARWARRFDAWVRDRVAALDVRSLLDFAASGPEAAAAVPTPEHFDPLFFVLGAASEADRRVDLYEGFRYGSLSLRAFAFVGPEADREDRHEAA